MYDVIVKLADNFNKLIINKIADLKSNMIIRILHSLIPPLVQLDNPLKIQEEMVYKIIPGAKEVLNYGIKAVAAEYKTIHSINEEEVITLLNSSFLEGLKKAAKGFRENNVIGYGGEPWAKFSEGLINLNNKIEEAERTGSKNSAMELTSYLNVIDGMMHNTASFLEKLVQQEGGYMTLDKQEDLTKLRDITRLPTEDVIALMEPYAKRTPEAKEFLPFFKEYRRFHPVKENEYEKALNLLKKQKVERSFKTPETQFKFMKKTPKPPIPKKR